MMKTMKKLFILLSATLLSFALASCQKEMETPEVSIAEPNIENSVIPFELNASIAETRTTLNTSTYAVSWEDSDVLYAVTTDAAWGDGTSSSDASGDNIATFTYSNGKFTTDKVIAAGAHTFNFIYEGSSQKKYHRATGTTHQLSATQDVDAENPAQNLKANDALVGQITKTIPASLTDITMSHIYTLMKVTLKNKLGAAVTATKFEIQIEDEDIAGIFDVAFDTPGVSLKSGGKDKITVNITNGAIAADGSIDVYFVMAPVTDFTGNVTFTVTDSNSNTYTKTNAVSDLTFAAGTYNTASYTLKTADPIECVTLDWDYAGGTAADLNAVSGVTTSGLGSDYAESNAPYRVKFDGTGDYIQVRTDVAISTVSVGYKMIGGNTTSTLTFKESANGSDWNDVQTLNIAGTQSSTGTLTTTNPFNNASRFVQIYFTKGANVGIGAISIHKLNTDPVISSSDISDVPAAGVTDTWTYTVKNFSDDVEVASFDGCVTDAIADAGSIVYSVSPNYNTVTNSGTIVLQSASDNSVTKTISVSQLASSLTVSTTEVLIPANSNDAEFTITSPEFGWSISADDDSHIVFDETGTASPSASTVSITSDLAATDAIQTIATLTIIRNSNASDPQKKQVVVKKDKAGGSDYTVSWTATAAANLGSPIGSQGGTDSGTIATTCADPALSYDWNYTRSLVTLKSGKSDYLALASGYIQMGSSNALENAVFRTSAIPGTIKSVTVDCYSYSGAHNITISVGGNTYLAKTATPSSSGSTKTGSGSSSGEIVISLTDGTRALYIKSITVVYNN